MNIIKRMSAAINKFFYIIATIIDEPAKEGSEPTTHYEASWTNVAIQAAMVVAMYVCAFADHWQ